MKWIKEYKLGKYIELIPLNFSILLGVEKIKQYMTLEITLVCIQNSNVTSSELIRLRHWLYRDVYNFNIKMLLIYDKSLFFQSTKKSALQPNFNHIKIFWVIKTKLL